MTIQVFYSRIWQYIPRFFSPSFSSSTPSLLPSSSVSLASYLLGSYFSAMNWCCVLAESQNK